LHRLDLESELFYNTLCKTVDIGEKTDYSHGKIPYINLNFQSNLILQEIKI